jgi:hypothetical protein
VSVPILRAVRTILLIAAASLPVSAQGTHGGTIAGTVRDSGAQPIPDADIIVRPGNHRARTDTAGRFIIAGMDGGGYAVYARKIGYAPEHWDIKLSKSGRIDLKIVLRRQQLDTVVVTASRNCPAYSLDGFFCRRRAGGGLFLDYPDIDERGVTYTGDLFRDIPGFRTTLVSTRSGLMPVGVRANGFGCIRALVDGHPASAANVVPAYTGDLSAMEVYLKPDSVPAAYQRYTWPGGDLTRTGRCSVIVYWTVWAPFSR